MALGAAVVYAGYVLVADRVVARVDPIVLAALVMTGAAMSMTAAGLRTGGLELGFDAERASEGTLEDELLNGFRSNAAGLSRWIAVKQRAADG